MSRLVRLAVATALVAAAGLAGSAPASANACTTDHGVTVVVDFHELGGGLQQVCDAGGGGQNASALFPDNGFPLTYVQRQPGFVCRVSGAPADDPCVNTPPANAYWGLWWSDGNSGSWRYSSVGVGSLTIPEGGSVAFSWNDSSSASPPGAPPPQHSDRPADGPSDDPEPSQQPTSQPSQPPTSGSGGQSGGQSGGTTGRGDPTASGGGESASPRPGDVRKRGDGRTGQGPEDGEDEPDIPSGDATPSDQTRTTSAEPPSSADDAGLPVWVGPVAVGGLLGVAGVATYLRRRTS